MVKNTFKVKGMYCTGCEGRIENRLKLIEGVKTVKANYNNEEVFVKYDYQKVTIQEMKEALEDLDYELLEDKTVQTKSENNIQIISLLVIIIASYIIFDHLGWLNIFNVFPQIENTMTYGMLFVVGLLTSVQSN